MSLIKPLRAIVLGAPGAGKGTVLTKLKNHFLDQIVTISSGDLLREKIKTDRESEISKLISKGRLVPNKLVIDLIFRRFEELKLFNSNNSWLLDGFPRNLDQAKELDDLLLDRGTPLNLVIELDVPHEVILRRIKNRFIHQPSGRIYNLEYNPPKVAGKDDITGEPLTKRPDDNVEVFAQRLLLYKDLVEPLKKHYAAQQLLHTVQGETSDIIYPKLLDFITKHYGVE